MKPLYTIALLILYPVQVLFAWPVIVANDWLCRKIREPDNVEWTWLLGKWSVRLFLVVAVGCLFLE